MDVPEQEKPTVQINKKPFFESTTGKITLAVASALVIFTVLFVTLNYFDIISPSGFRFLPKKASVSATSSPVKITLNQENYGFSAGDQTYTCPVPADFCKSQQLVKSNSQDSVLYKASSGSAVLSPQPAKSIANLAISQDTKNKKKYFYESTISKDGTSCYTVAYIMPIDAQISNIVDLKYFNDTNKIATLGNQTFTASGKEGNVMIQVRNSPLEKGSEPCSLLRKSPEFFQSF